MVTILSVDEAIKLEGVLIDARSPAEYEEDHINGAINIPLLNDAERHEIGIIYKQSSREDAIEKGLKYFSTRIPTLYKMLRGSEKKNIIVYCARGGMRSGIIASLLASVGFKVFKIKEGYKGFRNYILRRIEEYELKPKVIVLSGLTCVGKTEILEKLPNSVDLEGLAQHRGSLMGALGMKPVSQKKFENTLLLRLDELQDEDVIFIEGESRRIGDSIIPPFLWKAMCNGRNIKIVRSFERRAAMLARDYFKEEFISEQKEIISGLRRLISNKDKQEVVSLFENKEFVAAATIVLEKYYDPLYKHTLKEKNFEMEINSDDVDSAVKIISNL